MHAATQIDRPRTKGSLCSGCGGLDLATPGELKFVAEVDPEACAVLAHEYPHAPNLGDITTHQWGSDDHVGLLTAGFPCQPVSAAGQQKADGDTRWLWPAVLHTITAVSPDEIFLENVQNIVSILGGSVLAGILAQLRTAGYQCRWTVLGACAIGAPHHRHRWYLRGHRTHNPGEAVRLHNRCGAPRTGGRVLLPTPTTADGKGGPGSSGRDGGLNLRTAVTLLPTPVARDADSRGEGDRTYWDARAARRSNGMPLGAAMALLPTLAASPQRWGKFAEAVALWEAITGRPAPDPTMPAPRGGRRLNPALSEWMMGLPPGLITDSTDRSAALRIIGNGVVPAAAAAAYAQLCPLRQTAPERTPRG